MGNNNNNNNIHILSTTSHGIHNAANTTENNATAHQHSTNNTTSYENSNNNSTSSNITYHAIISHAFPCAGVLPHDETGAAIDTAVSESARNASGGPTNEDSII